MKRLSVFLILAGLFAVPASAETYGDAVPDEPVRPSNIKTVPRPAPAPMSPSIVATTPPPGPEGLPATTETPVVEREQWHLTAGHLIGKELTTWGERSGWTVLWLLRSENGKPRDLTVPADTEYQGSFKEAATAVIETLADNGLVIYGDFKDGNRTLIVRGAGPVILDPQ